MGDQGAWGRQQGSALPSAVKVVAPGCCGVPGGGDSSSLGTGPIRPPATDCWHGWRGQGARVGGVAQGSPVSRLLQGGWGPRVLEPQVRGCSSGVGVWGWSAWAVPQRTPSGSCSLVGTLGDCASAVMLFGPRGGICTGTGGLTRCNPGSQRRGWLRQGLQAGGTRAHRLSLLGIPVLGTV